jgi:hypothetical protein
VSRLLRITGFAQERDFVNHHRMFDRAVWSPRAAATMLFRLLLATCRPVWLGEPPGWLASKVKALIAVVVGIGDYGRQ